MNPDSAIKQASGPLYNVSGTSFINVLIKMTTSVEFFLSRDFSARTDQSLNTICNGFSYVAFGYYNEYKVWYVVIPSYILFNTFLPK